jgi:endonuclease/exonuclease/phosphatase family metal-dependent hydrolase
MSISRNPMPNPRLAVRSALLAVLLLPLAATAQTADEVVLDGSRDEWTSTPYVFTAPDRRDAPRAHGFAGVQGVKARHDADAVYLLLELDGDFALQGMTETLVLQLNEDADPATGWERDGMRGVDAEIEFSAPLGEGGERMGTGLRLLSGEGRASCVGRANVAGVMIAPSHASRWFEVRIPRGGESITFGKRMTARLVSRDASGDVVDETGEFSVDLRDPRPRAVPRGAGAADPLARAPGTDVRAVSWNVGRETIFREPEAYGAILRALAPDLLMLDEVAGGHSAEEVEALLNRVVPGDRPWRVAYGVSGGSQRGVIAVRGTAPRIVAPFDAPIAYPDSTRGIITPGSGQGRWLYSRLEARVPATGALVEIGGRTLFAVTVDLESGGTPGSERDRLRRIEALEIRRVAEEALHTGLRPDGVDGILLTGDLNLVGTRDPLDILAAPAGDGPPFVVALPLRLDGASAATWRNPEEPFTPGRLDFVLVHPAFLAVAGGFVFSSADLSPEWRARHGLGEETSAVTDHLPVVTDLRWVDR